MCIHVMCMSRQCIVCVCTFYIHCSLCVSFSLVPKPSVEKHEKVYMKVWVQVPRYIRMSALLYISIYMTINVWLNIASV